MADQPKLNRQQAESFLRSLYPEGEQCFLANHTRTWLSAHLGEVPRTMPSWSGDTEGLAKLTGLADLLRAIVDALALPDEIKF